MAAARLLPRASLRCLRSLRSLRSLPFSCPYRSVSGAFFGLGGGVTHSGLSGGVEGVALLATLLGVVGLALGVFGVDSSTSNSGARFGMI